MFTFRRDIDEIDQSFTTGNTDAHLGIEKFLKFTGKF